MVQKEQIHSNAELRRVGSILSSDASSPEDVESALKILNDWRRMHYYPMFVFYMRLKKIAEKQGNGTLVALRLKRVPSIIAKLKRNYGGNDPFISLYRMQDIGGCRIVVSTIPMAQKIAEEYYIKAKGDIKHDLIRVTDYISKPKMDGYRGIHLVYSYKSTRKGKQKYNGLLIEIQIRSKLQHIWATAVEIVSFFTREAIKSNVGNPKWIEFFKLVSSAFAKMENCPNVPDTPEDEKTLNAKIKEIEKELSVINNLNSWTNAMNIFDEEVKKGIRGKLFLLELDLIGRKLDVYPFLEKNKEDAIKKYDELEERYRGNKEYDVVLAGVEVAHDLKKAYPNYYVDAGEFIRILKQIIGN